MVIDKPQCGLDTCRYYFDGNCTNEKRYRVCEFAYLKTLEVTGRLIEQKHGERQPVLFDSKCSLCGYSETTPLMIMRRDFKYCPNCGAKMLKELEGEHIADVRKMGKE